jgi:multidrug efflux pump subunit AcrA (membrane-fusion protein)
VLTSVVESGTEIQPGEVLVLLETLAIEEQISERTKFYHLAEAQVARSGADVAKAKLAISEYQEGRFISELATIQKDLAIAESRLLNATNRLSHTLVMSRSEYAGELEVEEKEFAVSQAELNVKLTQTRIEVLKEFTKKQELVRLNGELEAAEATHKADIEPGRLTEGLRPGMSVEVEIVVARHENVLTVPATAVLETQAGYSCWVTKNDTAERRSVTLGDHNEMFILVEGGLQAGEVVILDPLANVEEAQVEAARLLEAAKKTESPLDAL